MTHTLVGLSALRRSCHAISHAARAGGVPMVDPPVPGGNQRICCAVGESRTPTIVRSPEPESESLLNHRRELAPWRGSRSGKPRRLRPATRDHCASESRRWSRRSFPVSITGPARDRLLQRGKGLGPVNVADGPRGVATGDPVRGRLQQVLEHLRIATAGRIGAVGALVSLHGVAQPARAAHRRGRSAARGVDRLDSGGRRRTPGRAPPRSGAPRVPACRGSA